MMDQPSKQIKIHKAPQLGSTTQIFWLQSSEKLPFAQQETHDDHDEYHKKQHQAYLAQKLKRKQEIMRNKLKQFGFSSSDSDNQIKNDKNDKNATNDSCNEHKILKTFDYHSAKGSSKADSQNEVTLKKMQSVQVSSSKSVQSIVVLDIFINSKKGVDIWIQQNLKFKEKTIKFLDLECQYYDLNKIKLIFIENVEQTFKIKINWNSKQFIFASSRIKNYYELPQVFYIFVRIITQKLEIMNKNKLYEEKTVHFPESMAKNSLIYGKILKKSRLINKWSSVYASINNQGLWYSKKYSDKQKIMAKRGQITQFWTRFQFQEGHLIVKLFQNNSKIEIGIPVTNFMKKYSWLYNIYELAFKKI